MNTYTEFSFTIPLRTLAECEWVETLLANPPESLRPEWCEEDDLTVEFEWAIDATTEGHELCLYSDGYANTDVVEEFLRLFLANAPTELRALGFEACYRGDYPRPGEFGGFAAVVWRDDKGEIYTDYQSTQSWLAGKLGDLS